MVRNIHDDESLANLEKISSAWIKVGLQYSYCTFILIISTQVTVWPLGLLFDIQTNIIHIYIYVFVYTFSMPWYHFPLILGHLNYGLPIWFTVTVSTDFTYCLFWFYSFILLMCSKGHRELELQIRLLSTKHIFFSSSILILWWISCSVWCKKWDMSWINWLPIKLGI